MRFGFAVVFAIFAINVSANPLNSPNGNGVEIVNYVNEQFPENNGYRFS